MPIERYCQQTAENVDENFTKKNYEKCCYKPCDFQHFSPLQLQIQTNTNKLIDKEKTFD